MNDSKNAAANTYNAGPSELRKGIMASVLTLVAGVLLVGAVKVSERHIQADELCSARGYDACEQDDRCHVESDGLTTACPDDAPHCHEVCVRGMASR